LIYQNGLNSIIENQEAGYLGFLTSATERMRITPSGSVGIGTDSPGATDWNASATLLHIYQNSTNGSILKLESSNASGIVAVGNNAMALGTTTDDALTLVTNATERVRITSGGYLKASNTGSYINSTGAYHEFNSNTTDYFTLYVKNTNSGGEGLLSELNSSNSSKSFFAGYSASDSAYNFVVRTNGDVQSATGVYGSSPSDIRLKENIIDATSKLEDIIKLRVVNFNLLGKEEKHIGFIAQEMQEVFPSFVYQTDTRKYDEDGNLISGLEDALGIKVGMEFAILVKAIQEQQAQIESLKAEIQTVKQ
jgi:hypothetical protein